MYTMFLDATKAFDHVNYIKVFRILIDKGLCPLECRFLVYMYDNIYRVKCKSEVTDNFKVTNGVRQGGVLSPVLFGVYIDKLLDDLSRHKYGCFIGNLFIGALAYADDIVILARTGNALKEMLTRANNFSSQYDIHFNMSKGQFVIFTVDRKFNSAETIECNGVSIKAQCAADHLGNTLYVGLSKAVEKYTRDFNTSVNALIAYFGVRQ